MKIGLFFGSFNPVHIGHMAIANYFAEFTDLDKIWFVLSPQNPFKKKASLLDEYARKELLEIAIGEDSRFHVSTIEFNLPKPSYTIDTLIHLGEKYPNYSFSLIMGSDNIKSILKWKNAEIILSDYPIYVYQRPDAPINNLPKGNIILTEAPHFQISSTFIRSSIKDGKDLNYFLPTGVWKQLDLMNYYR